MRETERQTDRVKDRHRERQIRERQTKVKTGTEADRFIQRVTEKQKARHRKHR